jgi:hypothetical protein
MLALVPVSQNTLAACAPLRRMNEVAVAVVSDDAAWNTHTALALPCPSSVTVAAEMSSVAEQ